MKSHRSLLCFLASLWFANGLWAQPPNDLFVNRTILTGTNITLLESNSAAGKNEIGEPSGSEGVKWFYSVWYEWTAPSNGVVHLSCSSTVLNFYPSVVAYRGSTVDTLTPAATTDDGGVPVTAGDTIAI